MTVGVVTSVDGQWAAIRNGRALTLIERPPVEDAPPPASIELATEDVDLAIVLPGGLVVVEHAPGSPSRVLLLTLPEFDVATAIELDATYRIAALTGSRIVLGNGGPQHVIVRVAQRALAAQALEPGTADFVAGMAGNQLVFGLPKKLEIWDAVSARPMLRMQLQLPPPPRVVGTALGHLFVTRPGSDEVYVYRLSDGRPFRHQAGAKVERAISHPASGIVVLVTSRGLVRINCFAHSLTLIDTPWTPGTALALHGTGDAVVLLGLSEAGEAWRIALDAPHLTSSEIVQVPTSPSAPVRATTSPPIAPIMPATPRSPAWRQMLSDAARALVRGEPAALSLPADCELDALAARLRLSDAAHRTLTTLYALYLIGETLSIARLAEITDDWNEPLGQGELARHALLRSLPDGHVRLRHVVSNLLNGARPHAVRLAGTLPTAHRHGAFKLVRRGRTDAAIEAALIDQLGKIAVIEGDVAAGLLEARLHDAVALAHVAPETRPAPWPHDVIAIIVVDDRSSRWVTELPAFDAI